MSSQARTNKWDFNSWVVSSCLILMISRKIASWRRRFKKLHSCHASWRAQAGRRLLLNEVQLNFISAPSVLREWVTRMTMMPLIEKIKQFSSSEVILQASAEQSWWEEWAQQSKKLLLAEYNKQRSLRPRRRAASIVVSRATVSMQSTTCPGWRSRTCTTRHAPRNTGRRSRILTCKICSFHITQRGYTTARICRRGPPSPIFRIIQ